MSGLSRRLFITRTSLGMAAAGVLTAVPGLSSIASEAESEAPGVGSATLEEPLVAHVTDLQTGEMSLFYGEREIPLRDPALAAKIFNAAK